MVDDEKRNSEEKQEVPIKPSKTNPNSTSAKVDDKNGTTKLSAQRVDQNHWQPKDSISILQESNTARENTANVGKTSRKSVQFIDSNESKLSIIQQLRNYGSGERMKVSTPPIPIPSSHRMSMTMQNPTIEVSEKAQSDVHYFQHESGCCSCFKCCFVSCVLCCYIACPPVPEIITRKLAFRPPSRGTYLISYVTNDGRLCNAMSAYQAYEKLGLAYVPKPGHELFVSTRVFIVKTANGNYLVAVMLNRSSMSVSNEPSSNNEANLVLLIAQPNASDLGDLHIFQRFCDLVDADVCLFDYSGYGLSTGRPSESNIYEDLRSVYMAILSLRPNAKIVLIGLSIGSAASIDLASKKPERLAGMILIAAFTSGCRIFRNEPNRKDSRAFDRFKSIDKVNEVEVPTLLIHGKCDEFISIDHCYAIYARLRNPVPPLHVENATHGNIIDHELFPEVYDRMIHFLKHETV